MTNTVLDIDPTLLNKYAQVIPSEMLEEIQDAANAKGLSLEVEIASRLMATFANPAEFGVATTSEAILNHSFTDKDAFDECKRNHESWLYLYEMEKLRLFMQFKQKLPRNIKESFMMIDVAEATKQIEAEFQGK